MFCLQYFSDAFHYHFPVGLILILEPKIEFFDNFYDSNTHCYLHSSFNELFIISFLRCHSPDPEAAEILLQYILT